MEDDSLLQQLQCLCPAPPDRSGWEAAFEAGRRSGRRSARVWQVAASVCALVALLPLLTRHRVLEPEGERNIAVVEERRPAAAIRTDDRPAMADADEEAGSYLAFREVLLTRGIEALPTPAPFTFTTRGPL